MHIWRYRYSRSTTLASAGCRLRVALDYHLPLPCLRYVRVRADQLANLRVAGAAVRAIDELRVREVAEMRAAYEELELTRAEAAYLTLSEYVYAQARRA